MHSTVPDEFKPVIFGPGGLRLPFPAPTGRVQVPNKVPRKVWKSWQNTKAISAGNQRDVAQACSQTSMMLRNTPPELTRDMLRSLLDNSGFKECYDFMYLPLDFKTLSGIGYAILNFVAAAHAVRFEVSFQEFTDWPIASDKVAKVVRMQGADHMNLEANIRRYRNSPVMHSSVPDQFKPIIFVNGKPAPFPEPTVKIYPPAKLQFQHNVCNETPPAPTNNALLCDGVRPQTTLGAPPGLVLQPPPGLLEVPPGLAHELSCLEDESSFCLGLDAIDKDCETAAGFNIEIPALSAMMPAFVPVSISATGEEAAALTKNAMLELHASVQKRKTQDAAIKMKMPSDFDGLSNFDLAATKTTTFDFDTVRAAPVF